MASTFNTVHPRPATAPPAPPARPTLGAARTVFAQAIEGCIAAIDTRLGPVDDVSHQTLRANLGEVLGRWMAQTVVRDIANIELDAGD